MSGIVEVRTPGRLHLGMISFGNSAVPSFGGVGVMVAGLGVGVRLTPASTLTASGPLADRAVAFARQCAEAWSLGQVGCAIEVTAAPPAHVGTLDVAPQSATLAYVAVETAPPAGTPRATGVATSGRCRARRRFRARPAASNRARWFSQLGSLM
jgi:hypothetical protein